MWVPRLTERDRNERKELPKRKVPHFRPLPSTHLTLPYLLSPRQSLPTLHFISPPVPSPPLTSPQLDWQGKAG